MQRRKDLNLVCRDVRAREVGIKEIKDKIKPENVELIRRDYYANDGWETFLSYEDPKQDILIGLLRLRKCGPATYRPELVNNCSIALHWLKSLNILTIESSKTYLESNLYGILMSNDTIKSSTFAIDIMIKIIGTNEEKTMYIIDAAEKYAKKTHTKIYSQIVNLLRETNKEVDLKTLALVFINLIMNYCHPSKLPRILIQLRDVGIFEFLDRPRKHEEKFEEQVKNFIKKTEEVLNDSDYEVEIYKKEIEDMKTHCYEIEKKYLSFTESNEFYEFIINDFVKYLNISDCISTQAGVTDSKAPRERIDKNLNLKFTVDSNGLIESQKLLGRSCGVSRPVIAASILNKTPENFKKNVEKLKDKIEQLLI